MHAMEHDKLRIRRLAKRLKLRDVADKLGVKPWTLCKWERGTRRPDEGEWKRWRKALR